MRRQYRSRSSLCITTGLLSAVLLSTASTNIGNVHAETVDYNVNIEPSLVVTIPSNTVELNINPVTTQFNSADLSVTVGTNNATGYTLTMSSDSTELSKAGSTDTIPTLETLAGGYPEADFTVNHWGYKLSTATNYLPFATSNELDVTNAPTNSKTSIVNFAAKADLSKPAGTYKLAIDFTAVANYVPPTPFSLYNSVAALSKGKNTEPETSHFSWTEITTPNSADHTKDTSTSGVFEWDGQDSNNGSQKIYFYRGILETNEGSGTYGSDGSANAYPNYVKLSNNTCWRIVRTTSTGGVKIIYNGSWKNNTCANATTAAELTNYPPFNDTSTTVSGTTYTGLQRQNIHAVGYTYSSLAAGTTAATPISTIFGSTGNDTATNTNSSIIKQYLESWYHANMIDYTSKLEGDAGFCNDRTLNTGKSWTVPLADNAEIIPYGATDMTEDYFGSSPRNANSSTFSPTLTCPRGKVDLYSYTSSAGNGNGNGQLSYPVALLTADEASLAGNGYNNSYNAYNANSYLRSGSYFWLLSPSDRYTLDGASVFVVHSNGSLRFSFVDNTFSVRPVISLSSDTRVLGSGTATEPWVVQ